MVFIRMNAKMKTSKYIFSFSKDAIEAEMLPTPKKEWVISGLFAMILFAIFLTLSIMGFVGASYGHAVVFMIASIALAVGAVGYTVSRKKQERIFRFKIDARGITHTDVNATYFLPWDEVAAFGIVNNNSISGTRSRAPYQICLYFSNTVYTEKYLRKRFDRIRNRRYMHCSSDDMVVFGFCENDVELFINSKIAPYFYLYCDKDKEINYLNELDELGFPN